MIIEDNKKNNVVFEKNIRGWCKKDKKIDWSFSKKCYQKNLQENESNTVNLNQSTIERSLLIHGQINLIKSVESNKFDKV